MVSFQGKRALVTGAAQGSGRATALAFAAAGADVALLDVNEEGGLASVELAAEHPGKCLFVRCDVSDASDVERAVGEAVNRLGGLDCAANVAAIEIEDAPVADCDVAVFDKVIAVNLRGTFLCLKHELRHMRQGGGGAIVNVSSVGGYEPQAGLPAYIASKHGVLGLTRNAALDHAGDGIRVNAVCPGLIRTPMLESALQRHGGGARPETFAALNRVGEPEDIAAAILWLCSPNANFITGASLAVDGGHVYQ